MAQLAWSVNMATNYIEVAIMDPFIPPFQFAASSIYASMTYVISIYVPQLVGIIIH